MELLQKLVSPIKELLQVVDNNKILNSILSLFLVLYAGLAAPKLPKKVSMLFNESWFKMIVLMLVVYMSTKDVSLAIITAVALVLSIQTYNYHYNSSVQVIKNVATRRTAKIIIENKIKEKKKAQEEKAKEEEKIDEIIDEKIDDIVEETPTIEAFDDNTYANL
mgnify:CR=1 FL=1|jgi:hypothetical protein